MQKLVPSVIADNIIYSLAPSFREQLATVSVLDTVSSTNDYLLSRKRPSAGQFNLCVAFSQNAGKGRHGRLWSSDYGGIYLSVAWCLPPTSYNVWIGLMCAVRLAERLTARGSLLEDMPIGVKWPNDLYYRGAKFAGILSEYRVGLAVLGIGLNIMTPKHPTADREIDWIGLDKAGISMASYCDLLVIVAESALSVNNHCRFEECHRRFAKFDLLYNQSIEVCGKYSSVQGVAKGVDEHGCLLVQKGRQLRSYDLDEVSVRYEATD